MDIVVIISWVLFVYMWHQFPPIVWINEKLGLEWHPDYPWLLNQILIMYRCESCMTFWLILFVMGFWPAVVGWGIAKVIHHWMTSVKIN